MTKANRRAVHIATTRADDKVAQTARRSLVHGSTPASCTAQRTLKLPQPVSKTSILLHTVCTFAEARHLPLRKCGSRDTNINDGRNSVDRSYSD